MGILDVALAAAQAAEILAPEIKALTEYISTGKWPKKCVLPKELKARAAIARRRAELADKYK
jgi:hypothetical protein